MTLGQKQIGLINTLSIWGCKLQSRTKLLEGRKRTEKPGPEPAVSKPVYLTIREGGFFLIYLHRMFLQPSALKLNEKLSSFSCRCRDSLGCS